MPTRSAGQVSLGVEHGTAVRVGGPRPQVDDLSRREAVANTLLGRRTVFIPQGASELHGAGDSATLSSGRFDGPGGVEPFGAGAPGVAGFQHMALLDEGHLFRRPDPETVALPVADLLGRSAENPAARMVGVDAQMQKVLPPPVTGIDQGGVEEVVADADEEVEPVVGRRAPGQPVGEVVIRWIDEDARQAHPVAVPGTGYLHVRHWWRRNPGRTRTSRRPCRRLPWLRGWRPSGRELRCRRGRRPV